MFLGAESLIGMAAGVVFSLLLAIACVSDLRSRRIPNALVLATLAAGVGFSIALDPALPGLGRSVAGAATGLVIWLPFWMLRKIGAGDVKLFAAAGAWLGPADAVTAALAAAVLGAVLTLAWLVWEQGVGRTARGLALGAASAQSGVRVPGLLVVPSRKRVPYGIALAAGAALVAWLPGLAR